MSVTSSTTNERKRRTSDFRKDVRAVSIAPPSAPRTEHPMSLANSDTILVVKDANDWSAMPLNSFRTLSTSSREIPWSLSHRTNVVWSFSFAWGKISFASHGIFFSRPINAATRFCALPLTLLS